MNDSSWRSSLLALILLSTVFFVGGCKTDIKKESASVSKGFPKNVPQPLTYQNVSTLIEDMKEFSQAVKAVNKKEVQAIDDRYQDVSFETEQQPLLLNLYPDPANGKVIHVVVPKDPQNGSEYVLRFDQKLPVIDIIPILAMTPSSLPGKVSWTS